MRIFSSEVRSVNLLQKPDFSESGLIFFLFLPIMYCMKKALFLSAVATALVFSAAESAPAKDPARPVPVHEKAVFHERGKVWVRMDSGVQTVWYENGTIKSKGGFRNNQREGKWIFYYSDGSLKAEGEFRSNLREGSWKLYHPGGKIQEEGSYINNLKNGRWVRYYISGQTESEGNYVNGLREGEWKNYYENGKIFYKGTYKNDMAEGFWQYYYKTGSLYQKGFYTADVRTGTWEICTGPIGPCSKETFSNPSSPRRAGLPPPDETPKVSSPYGTDDPAKLLDSLQNGGVPDQVPDELKKNPGGW